MPHKGQPISLASLLSQYQGETVILHTHRVLNLTVINPTSFFSSYGYQPHPRKKVHPQHPPQSQFLGLSVKDKENHHNYLQYATHNTHNTHNNNHNTNNAHNNNHNTHNTHNNNLNTHNTHNNWLPPLRQPSQGNPSGRKFFTNTKSRHKHKVHPAKQEHNKPKRPSFHPHRLEQHPQDHNDDMEMIQESIQDLQLPPEGIDPKLYQQLNRHFETIKQRVLAQLQLSNPSTLSLQHVVGQIQAATQDMVASYHHKHQEPISHHHQGHISHHHQGHISHHHQGHISHYNQGHISHYNQEEIAPRLQRDIGEDQMPRLELKKANGFSFNEYLKDPVSKAEGDSLNMIQEEESRNERDDAESRRQRNTESRKQRNTESRNERDHIESRKQRDHIESRKQRDNEKKSANIDIPVDSIRVEVQSLSQHATAIQSKVFHQPPPYSMSKQYSQHHTQLHRNDTDRNDTDRNDTERNQPIFPKEDLQSLNRVDEHPHDNILPIGCKDIPVSGLQDKMDPEILRYSPLKFRKKEELVDQFVKINLVQKESASIIIE